MPLCEMARCTLPAVADVRVTLAHSVTSGPSRMCALCLANARARIGLERENIELQVTPYKENHAKSR